MADAVLDDHGIEVLRKAGLVDGNGDVRLRTTEASGSSLLTEIQNLVSALVLYNRQYRMRMLSLRNLNTVDSKKTNIVNTGAKKIDFPEESDFCLMCHIESGETAWIGKDSNITAASDGTFPLWDKEYVSFDLRKGNDNNVYGITASGDIDIYTVGFSIE